MVAFFQLSAFGFQLSFHNQLNCKQYYLLNCFSFISSLSAGSFFAHYSTQTHTMQVNLTGQVKLASESEESARERTSWAALTLHSYMCVYIYKCLYIFIYKLTLYKRLT